MVVLIWVRFPYKAQMLNLKFISMKDLIEFNGFWFVENTPKKVMEIISGNYHKNRIRFFYGFTDEKKDAFKNGLCWNEEYYTIGTIGRSTGVKKIPLLLQTKNSSGGGGILTDCIVKITIDKETVYKHPNFHFPVMEVKGSNYFENGNLVATFKTDIQAQRFFQFLKGERNCK
jgi:hypothetical protein